MPGLNAIIIAIPIITIIIIITILSHFFMFAVVFTTAAGSCVSPIDGRMRQTGKNLNSGSADEGAPVWSGTRSYLVFLTRRTLSAQGFWLQWYL